MPPQNSLHNKRHKALVDKLVQARIEAGMTQMEVAKRMGRTQRFISYCETGERRVDVVEFLDFCRAYELPPSWFVKGWPE